MEELMAFDMMPLKLAFSMIAANEHTVEVAREGLERSKAMLQEEKQALIGLVEPIFFSAIDTINTDLSYKIVKEGLLCVIDVSAQQITLDATLLNDQLDEPDELITNSDVERLTKLLSAIVNPQLEYSEIPFQFVGIIFPPEYFSN